MGKIMRERFALLSKTIQENPGRTESELLALVDYPGGTLAHCITIGLRKKQFIKRFLANSFPVRAIYFLYGDQLADFHAETMEEARWKYEDHQKRARKYTINKLLGDK